MHTPRTPLPDMRVPRAAKVQYASAQTGIANLWHLLNTEVGTPDDEDRDDETVMTS